MLLKSLHTALTTGLMANSWLAMTVSIDFAGINVYVIPCPATHSLRQGMQYGSGPDDITGPATGKAQSVITGYGKPGAPPRPADVMLNLPGTGLSEHPVDRF